MTAKTTTDVWNEIQGVTKPLETTLKALAENPNGSAAGKEQAKKNLDVVHDLNTTGAQLAAQASHTELHNVGMRRGGSSPSESPKVDDKK